MEWINTLEAGFKPVFLFLLWRKTDAYKQAEINALFKDGMSFIAANNRSF
ncbi:hypothetical protein [Vibrio diabolicus]|nr:hypothetical protein [Vibrio diabolicus]